jgi:3-hydroxybutyryl-CoA dehydratase
LSGRELAPGLYHLDDLRPGDRWRTGGITVTDWHVLTFAGLAGDFFDVHTDDAFARGLGFPGRIAHGLLGLALVDGLKNRADARLAAVASLGWRWGFAAPIRPGDRIAAEVEVLEVIPSRSKHDRGVARLGFQVLNQDGALVQEGENTLMMLRRRGDGRPAAASP